MGEASRDEYKIQSFDAQTQQLLKTALKDPGAVDLERVANVIVDHSLQDCVFSKEAGRMCYAIIQVGGLAEWEAALRLPPQGQAQAAQQKCLGRDRPGQVVASALLSAPSSHRQRVSKQARASSAVGSSTGCRRSTMPGSSFEHAPCRAGSAMSPLSATSLTT